ncbi:Imidazolonepropionase [Candidatus Thermokryptus mobilis]|uniref:Imidazolonepropionase n=1 Tax=Candidatus Thermokryptus mobilis TaxID=1643428 RepID=A0A0S4MR20_9BACT|nr:amidohydrolase family protein [Candidatus Thermokryptus mobilis]CUU01348.1 Imidazolonepropionase [Candidatus Thermokryptus mobilis]
MKRILLSLLILATSLGISQEKIKVIKCGSLIDVKNEQVRKNVLILIKENKIERVGTFEIPPEAEVIDLSDMTVLPGLIDSHVHLFLHEGSYDEQLLKESTPYRTIRAVVHAKQTLEAGFTTIRDLETEGAGYADVDLKTAINQGIIPGPRMQVATRALSTTGGYALMGYSWEIQVPTGAQLVDGVDEVRKAVREQIKYGADWIKIYADSRRRRNEVADSLTWYLTFSDDELKAIVEEAQKMNIKVAAHCYSSIAAQRAINAGVASIEHGLYLDEATLKLMKEKGVYYCPTLVAYYRWSKREGLSPEMIKMIENTVKLHSETFKRALKVGVKIAFGSDLTESHGTNAEEFELMVKYGMKPFDAIKSATIISAELLGWQDKIGSIEPGKLADIIAVKGDPLNDIKVLRDVKFVMKDGEIYKFAK